MAGRWPMIFLRGKEVCVEYVLWFTHSSRVVLPVGALRVAWGALQCTQTIGKYPLAVWWSSQG